MNIILESLTTYYGLDWAAMCLGLYGTFLITRHNRMGFLFSSLACICGLMVAAMSHQTGYIVYNFIIMAMMSRTFLMNKTSTAT